MTRKKARLLVSMMLAVFILSACTQEYELNEVSNQNETAIVKTDNIIESVDNEDVDKVDLAALTPIFLDATEAAIALAQEDEYIKVLSPYDYASKFKSNKPLSEAERLSFFGSRTLEFNENEMERIESSMAVVHSKLHKLNLSLPESIGFIKTDGTEEGGAAYTRALNIIIPKQYFNMNKKRFDALIAHEYFHVYSRYFSDRRPELYELIGFKTSKGVNLPESIKELTIANPDAPDTIYYFTDIFEGEETHFLPIIYSSEAYDIESNNSFFETMIIKVIAVSVEDGILTPIIKEGEFVFTDFETLPKFEEATGGNTDYIIHPEEILADNFSVYIMDLKVNEQWVIDALIDKMREF